MNQLAVRNFQVLKPYKALAENWEVDISEDLLEYLSALELVGTEEQEGEISYLDLNFAQAALLVQNSGLVYAKKVDLLYDLVFIALENLSISCAAPTGNKVKPHRQSMRSASSAASAEIAIELRESAFAPLDEVSDFPLTTTTAAAGDLHQVERSSNARVGLMKHCFARQFANGGEEFNIARLSIDPHSGLLQLESQQLQEEEMQVDSTAAPILTEEDVSNNEDSPIIDDSFHNDDDDGGGAFGDEYIPADNHSVGPQPVTTLVDDDEFLDPYVPSVKKKDKAFQKGQVFSLPKPPPSSSSLSSKMFCELTPTTSFNNSDLECESILQWIGCTALAPNRKLTQPLCFPELEPIRVLRRKQQRALAKSLQEQEEYTPAADAPPSSPREEEEEDYYNNQTDYAGGDESFTTQDDDTTAALQDVGGVTPQQNDMELAELQTYSQVVRTHVNRFLLDCRAWAQESKLSLRVNMWHMYLEPILERESARPEFDLKLTQHVILDTLPSSACSFDVLVLGSSTNSKDKENSFNKRNAMASTTVIVEVWQVCRMFLTTLVLANAGSLEIHDNRQDERCFSEKEFHCEESFMVKATSLKSTTPRLPKKRMRMSLENL